MMQHFQTHSVFFFVFSFFSCFIIDSLFALLLNSHYFNAFSRSQETLCSNLFNSRCRLIINVFLLFQGLIFHFHAEVNLYIIQ